MLAAVRPAQIKGRVLRPSCGCTHGRMYGCGRCLLRLVQACGMRSEVVVGRSGGSEKRKLRLLWAGAADWKIARIVRQERQGSR